MKTLKAIFLFVCIPLLCMSQSKIILRSGNVIRKIVVREISDTKVTYFEYGSLHDVDINDISCIISQEEKTFFDENNKPINCRKDLLISYKGDTINAHILHISKDTIWFRTKEKRWKNLCTPKKNITKYVMDKKLYIVGVDGDESYIMLRGGRIISDAVVRSLNTDNVVYLKNGSLHDIEKGKISKIVLRGKIVELEE